MNNYEIRIANTTTGWFAVVIVKTKRYCETFYSFRRACEWALNMATDGGVQVSIEREPNIRMN